MIVVHSNAALIAHYRRLLRSEWKRGFPDEVLAVLWRTISSSVATNGADEYLRCLNPKRHPVWSPTRVEDLAKRFSEAVRFLDVPSLPKLPSRFPAPRRPSKAADNAIRFALYLTLHAYQSLTGRVAFFRDLQSLAFQASYHVLLNDLQDKHHAEHALLLHAMILFAAGYEHTDPAHFNYLMSMVHGYLGNREERLRDLLVSFRLTLPADHSFLTKAQDYWSELMDQGRSEEAEKFLLGLHAECLPDQKDEVHAMLVSAIEHKLLHHL